MTMPAGNLAHGGAGECHQVRGLQSRAGTEGDLALARPEFDLQRPQRQAEALQTLADVLVDGIDGVVEFLAQILVAFGGQRHVGRPAGLRRILWPQPRIDEAEQVKFQLRTGHQAIASRGQAGEVCAGEIAGGQRHRPAIGKAQIAEDPAGMRRPRQDAERGRIGHEHQVARTRHLRQPDAAAGLKGGEDRAVRRILQQQGGRAADAALEPAHRLRRDQRLAAEDAVLIDEGEADDLDAVTLDPPNDVGLAAAALSGSQRP